MDSSIHFLDATEPYFLLIFVNWKYHDTVDIFHSVLWNYRS